MMTSRLSLFEKFDCRSMIAMCLLSSIVVYPSNESLANVRHPAANQQGKKGPPPAASTPLSINKQLITETEAKELKSREMRKLETVIRKGKLAGNEAAIKKWVRLSVYVMTLKKHRDEVRIHADLKKMMDIVRRAGYQAANEADKLPIRKFLCEEIAKRCEDLLDNQLAVRLQAVTALYQLNILERDPRSGRKTAIAYAPAGLALVKILQDPKQHIGVKLIAVQGMTRISRTGNVSYGMTISLSRKIGNAVLAELQKKKTHYKYQVRLAESLGALRLAYDSRNQPIYVDGLCRAMIDQKRHPEVRAMAAEALGVAKFSTGISNPQVRALIAHEILRTTHEIAGKYNASLKNGVSGTNWKTSFLRLYFAFEGEPFLRKNLGSAGLASRFPNDTRINAALVAIKPVIRHIVEKGSYFKDKAPQPVPQAMMNALAKVIQDNPPTTDRLSPGLKPLRNVTASTVDPNDQK